MRIGIRREDKNQWEARVPLIPEHIREILNQQPVEIFIQPSTIRAFSDQEYRQAGAVVQEDLSHCDITFAVKEIPIDFFLPNKSYIFFSHTIKGQMYNMPSLKRLLDLKATLFDYEKITDDQGQRIVFFGRYAGIAGMIDTFWALGQRLNFEKQKTLFKNLKQALKYSSLVDIRNDYQEIAGQIAKHGIPKSLSPMVFGFTGYGNVSKGAQEMFDIFPHMELQPEELSEFFRKGEFSNKHLYKVVFKEQHLAKSRDSRRNVNLQDYYDNPENYKSRFEEFLPYITVLINAIYWDDRYPKLVTRSYLQDCQKTNQSLPLKVIGDIACDIGGSIECNKKITDSGNPVYNYNPSTGDIQMGIEGAGPVILAVDNLPAELPRESSTFFSTVLKDYIPALIQADFETSFDDIDLPADLKRAVIVYKGNFTPDYKYMKDFIQNL